MDRNEAIEIVRKNWPDGRHQLREALRTLIPELKENEDERIRKAIHIYLDFLDGRKDCAPKGEYTIKDMISWLEKQGEHIKFLKSIQIGDEVTRNPDGVLVNLSQLKRKSEQGSQNLANSTKTCKVEPKFKVGDWVVTENGKVNQVKTVSDDGDAYTLDDETYFSGSWKDMYHLWTIQDAKDGDVLAEHETIVVFKEIDGLNIRCYCTYPDLHVDTLQNKTPYCPATKEQRDLLFQKMKEAGYSWDAEKKDLKKIEQKHTPKHRVGDTIYYNSFGELKSMIVANVVTDSTDNPMYEDKEGNAVFEKDIIEQNPAWSKEDEISINEIIETLNIVQANRLRTQRTHYSKATIDKDIAFLKFLKERYTWKSSNGHYELEE